MLKHIRKIIFLKIVKHILENNISATRLKFKKYNYCLGSTHKDFSIRESLFYINRVFDDYLKYSQITKDNIAGKNILEIGPGDNFGVALKFIANGAHKIICLDRIYSSRNDKQQYSIYSALRDEFDANMKINFDSAIQLKGSCFRFNEDKIKYIYGVGISNADSLLKEEQFDFIISRAVLEHIYDIDSAFYVMNRHLKKKGYIIHKIDLRDHDMFSKDGFNPLTFLTIPELVWRHMTKHCGKPNRKRIDYYKQKLEQIGYSYKIWITHLISCEDEILPHKERIIQYLDYDDKDLEAINRIRSKLSKEFRNLSDQALLVAGIFIIAKKE